MDFAARAGWLEGDAMTDHHKKERSARDYGTSGT